MNIWIYTPPINVLVSALGKRDHLQNIGNDTYAPIERKKYNN